MNSSAPCLLGLDIGARQIGVAIFEGEKLRFYAVKSIKRASQSETLLYLYKVMEKLITGYAVKIIAVEQVIYPQQQRSFAKTIYQAVKDFVMKKSLEIFEYRPDLIRRTICRDITPTKENTFKILTGKYTELRRYLTFNKPWQKNYYTYLFSAIAVGLVGISQLTPIT